MKVLFLFESPLPSSYHSQTLSPGELRVMASLPQVENIIALGPEGKSFYDINAKTNKKTWLEQKITLHKFQSIFPYYLRFIPIFWHALKIIRSEKIDLIHAESPHVSGIAAVLLKRIYKIKIAVEYRASYDEIFQYRFKFIPSQIKSYLFWKLCDWVFNNCDLILANSQTYATYLKKRYPQNEIYHYNPGVRPPDKITKVNQKKIIGFLGRLYPDKGAIYLLEAVNLIKDELVAQKWSLEIAGDGPDKENLKSYIKDHKLQSLVRLLGTQDRWQFLAKTKILVNPNIISNALEMVNVEAATLSKPVVCFGDQHTPETVIHLQTGIKVPNLDTKAMAQAILKLISDDKLRVKLGRGAHQHYQSHYTFAKQTANLANAYKSISLK